MCEKNEVHIGEQALFLYFIEYTFFIYVGNLFHLIELLGVDFIFIDDICNAINNVIDNPIKGVYNVSTGDGNTIKNICDYILDIKGLDKLKFIYTSKNKIKSRLVLDPQLFKKTFKWDAKITLEMGIKNFIQKERK